MHAIYIDISKAFDSIQHWHIEEVLKYYKINPKLIAAIMNLLKKKGQTKNSLTGHRIV